MRYIITLLFLTTGLSAQVRPYLDNIPNTWVTHHNTYVTPSIAQSGESYLRVEHEITEGFVILQVAYQTDFRQHYIQAKMGIGYNGRKVRAYLYLPYFNYSITENGYNTPYCAEVFFDKLTPRIGVSCNLDIYQNQVVPSVRFRLKAFHFKQTRFKPTSKWN